MRLIVDTSRIIAALIKDSASRAILLSDKFEFLTVNFTKLEVEEHKQEIKQKARLRESDFEAVLSLLLSHVEIINDITLSSHIQEAETIMRSIDPDDVPFIAAALAVDNQGIWTDDEHFTRQKRIGVFKTSILLKILIGLNR